MVTKGPGDIDLQGSHGPKPLLVNKSLPRGRRSMHATVARAALFTQLEIHARLDQCCEQTTGFELHDACWHCFGIARNKVVRVSEISYLNWTRRSELGSDIPCVRIYMKIRLGF